MVGAPLHVHAHGVGPLRSLGGFQFLVTAVSYVVPARGGPMLYSLFTLYGHVTLGVCIWAILVPAGHPVSCAAVPDLHFSN